MICVTLRIDLPDWWGADDAFEAGGEQAVKELCQEDIQAMIEDAEWIIRKVEEK